MAPHPDAHDRDLADNVLGDQPERSRSGLQPCAIGHRPLGALHLVDRAQNVMSVVPPSEMFCHDHVEFHARPPAGEDRARNAAAVLDALQLHLGLVAGKGHTGHHVASPNPPRRHTRCLPIRHFLEARQHTKLHVVAQYAKFDPSGRRHLCAVGSPVPASPRRGSGPSFAAFDVSAGSWCRPPSTRCRCRSAPRRGGRRRPPPWCRCRRVPPAWGIPPLGLDPLEAATNGDFQPSSNFLRMLASGISLDPRRGQWAGAFSGGTCQPCHCANRHVHFLSSAHTARRSLLSPR